MSSFMGIYFYHDNKSAVTYASTNRNRRIVVLLQYVHQFQFGADSKRFPFRTWTHTHSNTGHCSPYIMHWLPSVLDNKLVYTQFRLLLQKLAGYLQTRPPS